MYILYGNQKIWTWVLSRVGNIDITKFTELFSLIFWIPNYRNSNKVNFGFILNYRNSSKYNFGIIPNYRNIVKTNFGNYRYRNTEILEFQYFDIKLFLCSYKSVVVEISKNICIKKLSNDFQINIVPNFPVRIFGKKTKWISIFNTCISIIPKLISIFILISVPNPGFK